MRRTEDGTGPARTPGGRGNIRRRALGRGVADELGPQAGGRGGEGGGGGWLGGARPGLLPCGWWVVAG